MNHRTRSSVQSLATRPARAVFALAQFLVAAPLLFGCEQPEAKKAAPPAEPVVPAVAQPTVAAAEKPAAVAPKAGDAPSATARPSKVDFQLTDERRAEVEKAYPEAKAFLTAMGIEESLKAKKVNSEKPALKAFDAAAKGKWVLFTGTMVNLTETGFDLGVTYTPQLPGDVMGMSRQWFPVTFSEIEGYDRAKFKLGQSVVVLAKYSGNQKAVSGYELIDQKHWN